MRTILRPLSLTALAAVLAAALPAADPADELRMNQIQCLGTHNSYKQAIDPSLWQLLDQANPGRFKGLEYSHRSLTEQLDHGLRKLEIDVVYDPEGGRYAKPLGLKMVADAGLPAGPAYDPEGLMLGPGLKVIHVPDIDFRTNVYTFQAALAELKRWSDAHPRHLPIAILMNAKDRSIERPGFVPLLPFDKEAYDAWDAEIRKGLGADKLITPDDVRGSHATLEEAVLAHDWPKLGWARGRFLFVLDEHGDKMETYIEGHPSLRGRVMFANAEEGRPEAAFRVVNNPVNDFDKIQSLVRAGYMVRTRADADTREARSGETARQEKAFASGAQYVSTDYWEPNPAFGTGYKAELPGGGEGRWNPVAGPENPPSAKP
ncbi:MAG: hypothetical protein GC160_06840 [Acidobacteria bacterium]|nr:hypothetical protein [Acidobacteriota bacterium]